jgi:hypothetical protein
MNTCGKCGASLAEAQAFCTVCGTRRIEPSATAPQRFCTVCGAPLSKDMKICEKCGAAAAVSEQATAIANSSATGRPGLQVVSSTAPDGTPSPTAPTTMKLFMIAVAMFALFLIAIMGSCAYIGYRAKQKGHAIEEAYKRNDMNKVASEPGINKSRTQDTRKGTASSSSSPASAQAAPYGWTIENGKLVPAKAPVVPPPPKADPVIPAAITGNQVKDWALKYERTENGPEADLVVRTGDINNLGFGWPQSFDPFSGNSTPPHQWPDINKIPAGAPDGTDRIILGSSVDSDGGDGYSGSLGDCARLRRMKTNARRFRAKIFPAWTTSVNASAI